MNLKYYLKGLGLGIVVTAVILGIHFSGSNKTMTDEEVKQRALELGMVENTTLVQVDEKTTEEMLDELNSDTASETENKTADADNTVSDEDSEATDTASDTEKSEAATDISKPEETSEDKFVSEKTADADNVKSEANVTDTGDKSEIQTVTDAADDPDKKTSDAKSTVITVSSGDSSITVAKKLADAGIIENAADFDTYLCTYGYDRHISTGTYTFTSGMDDESIAKTITGRK